jgi:hypothetical protein
MAKKSRPIARMKKRTGKAKVVATPQEPPEHDQKAWEELQKTALSVEELLQVREHLRITGQASA